MASSDRGSEEKGIQLTHHFKLWFGYEFRKAHIVRFIQHRMLNPTHDLVVFVNPQVLENPKNKVFLEILRKHHIEVVDMNKVVDPHNLEDQRLLYITNQLIQYGYDNKRGSAFAAASDIARWIPSLINYRCQPHQYRVYSDTDYYFDVVPNSIKGDYLFGTSSRQKEIFIKTANVDFNLIAIPADHALAKKIRRYWVAYFQADNYIPQNFVQLSELKKPNEILSLDDDYTFVVTPEEKLRDEKAISNQVATYGSGPAASKLNIMKPDVEEMLEDPKIVAEQRLADARILNLKEASWVTLKDSEDLVESKNEQITVQEELSGDIKLVIKKDFYYAEELIRFLTLTHILNDNSVFEKKDTFEKDFETTIPRKLKEDFLTLMSTYVCARDLPDKNLGGNLKEIILLRNKKLNVNLDELPDKKMSDKPKPDPKKDSPGPESPSSKSKSA